MGMSLPFLVRVVVTDVAAAGRRDRLAVRRQRAGGRGSARSRRRGCCCRAFGVRGAVLAAAAANLSVGLGALGLFALRERAGSRPAATDARRVDGARPEAPGCRPLALWLSLYALSGFVALSLEIVWFRVLDVAVKSTAFTFGTVLAVYLLGSAVGALAAAPRVARLRRPLRAFLLAQCALARARRPAGRRRGRAPAGYARARLVRRLLGGRTPSSRSGHEADRTSIVRLYVELPLLLFFLPTVLMGVSFPILQRAVHDDPATSGRKVGALQAANIAGCAAGSLLVGLVCLAAPGHAGHVAAAARPGHRLRRRRPALLRARVRGPGAGARRCSPPPCRARTASGGGSTGSPARVPLVFFEEDATSVVALTAGRGRLEAVGQRQGQQLDALSATAAPHPARRDPGHGAPRARATLPSSASARATRPGRRPGAPRRAR